MDKRQLFMSLTAVISIICFNFNKILDIIISIVAENIYDESTVIYGPYMKSKPVHIDCVMIDEHIYTNKAELLMNWKWDFDMMGITVPDLLLLKSSANNMVIKYRKKYSSECSEPCIIGIDFSKNTVTKSGKTCSILFNEISLFK